MNTQVLTVKSVDTEISDLFVTSKQIMEKVQSVLDRFIRCAEKNKDISNSFEKGHTLKDVLDSNTDFGKIKKTCHLKTRATSTMGKM